MTATAHECIATLLESCAPRRLLVIGDPPVPATAAATLTRVAVEDAAAELSALGRFDLVIVAGLAESLDAPAAEGVLGRLKNLHTDRFLLLVDPLCSKLGHDALLVLALAHVEKLADGRIAWRYDIDLYNPERRWNNPEDWANPENFEKFRW
jgi:hypothetical protein